MKNTLIKVVFVLIVLISALSIYMVMDKKETNIDYVINSDNSVTVIISSKKASDYEVALSNRDGIDTDTVFSKYEEDNRFFLNNGDNFILIKDKKGNLTVPEGCNTLSLNINKNFYPLYPVDEIIELDYTYTCLGNGNIIISSDNEDVVMVEKDTLKTINPGIANITISSNDMSDSFAIEVTDLYTKSDADSDLKPFLTTLLIKDPQEAKKLDDTLKMKIDEAGFGTRAGVVEAARFLGLNFPYKLAYFSEAGRLDPLSPRQSDGEGRYYHYGLFLSEDKFDDLGPSIFGRATWGQFFREDTSDDHSLDEFYLYDGFVPSDIGSQLYLSKRPNGLDCSGHVSWCYYNGGFDLGDLGAGGPGTHGMSQLGEFAWINDELLQSDRIKAGDLVGFAGHVGIVIGVEDNYIWISDNLVSGLKVKRYERNKTSFDELGHNSWQYFMLMDEVYKEDGNYTAMWED